MKYLIDTDWVVLHLKGSQAVTQKLKELYPLAFKTHFQYSKLDKTNNRIIQYSLKDIPP